MCTMLTFNSTHTSLTVPYLPSPDLTLPSLPCPSSFHFVTLPSLPCLSSFHFFTPVNLTGNPGRGQCSVLQQLPGTQEGEEGGQVLVRPAARGAYIFSKEIRVQGSDFGQQVSSMTRQLCKSPISLNFSRNLPLDKFCSPICGAVIRADSYKMSFLARAYYSTAPSAV